MSLEPGTRFGPYRIEGPLGAGGMGEVYRATDTRLGRVVALKVLPSHLSDRPDLKERFDREAKAISSLNHSNICALYDVGHENGIDYIVMEHIEGETLAERLGKGALPLDLMLALGSQIAQALHAAHRAGVVHRDLKPGNIMLTRGGVKLLDFGLAKMGAASAPPDSGSLPGMTAALTAPGSTEPLTREGTLLGTFQYMAPEQLEGKEADARSDLFALGSVLYEMVTGQKAFAGDSQASLIAAIMSKEPRPMGDLARVTPASLDRVVRACLVKDPEARIQSAHDVHLQLEWIAAGGADPEAGPEAGAPAPRRRGVTAVLAAGWLFALGLAALTLLQKDPAAPPGVRASILPPQGVRIPIEPLQIAVSPDGTRVVYTGIDSVGTKRLHLRPLNRSETAILPGTEGADLPFWSPDGRHIGFFVAGRMKRISVTGERVVQTICEATSGRGGTWGPDGTIVFSPGSSSPLFRVPATGGTPVAFTALDSTGGETAHRYPRFLPDGKHLIFVSLPGPDYRTQLVSLDDPSPTTLLVADGVAIVASESYLLFERQDALLAQKLDAGGKRMIGEPIPLPDRPGGSRGYDGSPGLAASESGVLAMIALQRTRADLEWFDRTGRSLGRVPVPPSDYEAPEFSPDGGRVTLEQTDPDGKTDIWVIELDRGIPTRLTTEAGDNRFPSWSRDGSRIAYSSTRGGSMNIYAKNAGGGPEQVLITMEGIFNEPREWLPDGTGLLLRSLQPETGEDILLGALDGTTRPFLATRFNEGDPVLSPDGRWLAYRSDESGRLEVYIQSFPDPGTRVRVSTGGSDVRARSDPMWNADGSELFFIGPDVRTVMRSEIQTTPEFRAGNPVPLFTLSDRGVQLRTIDGKRFLAVVPEQSDVPRTLSVVTDWTEVLRRER